MRAAVLLLAALWGAAGQAAQEQFRLSLDVPVVSIDVFVDDPTGKPITTLTREDFIVLEDGQPREIQNFASAETPYHLLLLFDRSSSTQNQWQFLLQAVSRLLEQLPEQHQIAFAAFDAKPEMLLDWRSPRAGSRQGLIVRTDGSGTELYGALQWAVDELKEFKGRKGVLVFTDGIDNRLAKDLVRFQGEEPVIAGPGEDKDYINMLRKVMTAQTPVYFVAINTDLNSGPDVLTTAFELQIRRQARQRMELVADRSNGHMYLPRDLTDIVRLYEQIGRELGNSYSLGFAPTRTTADGTYHRIEVRVRDQGLRVSSSREGYFAQ